MVRVGRALETDAYAFTVRQAGAFGTLTSRSAQSARSRYRQRAAPLEQHRRGPRTNGNPPCLMAERMRGHRDVLAPCTRSRDSGLLAADAVAEGA